MSMYTAVDEGWNVQVFRTTTALIQFIMDDGYAAVPYNLSIRYRDEDPDSIPKPSTAADVRKILRSAPRSFYLYDVKHYNGGDWVYKVQVHR